jgi:hypothetical protein
MNDEIEKYIWANRATYSREAITAELLKQGYSEADINTAWKALSNENSGIVKRREFWNILYAFLLGVPLVDGLIALFVKVLAGFNTAFSLSLFLFIAALLIGLNISIYLWQKKPVIARGLLAGVLLSLVLPFIPVIIIGGICSAGSFKLGSN